jgi:hypothetical protein
VYAVSADSTLERRYRRLLRAYPKDVRRRLENELMTVLLASAPPGRRVPPLTDAVNLVAHGLGSRVAARRTRDALVLPGRSSAPEPETYAEALRTVTLTGFRPTVDDWNWPSFRRPVKRALAAVLIVGAVLAVVSTVRYFRADAPFGPVGASAVSRASDASVPVGSTIWVGDGLTLSGGDTVWLDSVTPRVVANTAGARVVVMRCTGGAAEMLAESAEQFGAPGMCDTLTPWRPHAVAPSVAYERGVPVVLAVTPTRPGVVKIAGVRVTLHDGWRHGQQDVGFGWTFRATPSSG